MEFYIKKNATLPFLKVEICKDGRSDFNLNSFLDSNSTFYISLFDKTIDKILFSSKECFVTTEVSPFEGKTLYYLNYQFTNKDTIKEGRYEVQISAPSENGVIILPLQEKFYVNIIDSFAADNSSFSDLYSLNLPCCGFQETFDVDGLTLDAYYYSGSLIIDYVLTSTKVYNQDIRVNFTNVLEVISGTTVEIVTGVTINSGETRGVTQVIFPDYNFNNLTQSSLLSSVEFINTVPNTLFNFEGNVIFNTVPPTPTPTRTPTPTVTPTNTITPTPTNTITPTVTQTPTPSSTVTLTPSITVTPTNPCVEYITDEFGNFILTENGDYIISEINPCISPTPTKTPTPTPTNTPTNTPTLSITPSITSTLTPTITPSSSESLYPLTINVQSMSGGESIIFEGITYTANTTVNILINTTYLIEAVPSPGYILTGWGSIGGVSFEFLSGNTWTFSMNFTGGSSITPQYEEIPAPTPTPTVTPTMTETPTNTPSETVTLTPSITETETPTPTPTMTETPQIIESPTPTPTETVTPTLTNSPTNTETPTVTPTVTPSSGSTPSCPYRVGFFNTSGNVMRFDYNGYDNQIYVVTTGGTEVYDTSYSYIQTIPNSFTAGTPTSASIVFVSEFVYVGGDPSNQSIDIYDNINLTANIVNIGTDVLEMSVDRLGSYVGFTLGNDEYQQITVSTQNTGGLTNVTATTNGDISLSRIDDYFWIVSSGDTLVKFDSATKSIASTETIASGGYSGYRKTLLDDPNNGYTYILVNGQSLMIYDGGGFNSEIDLTSYSGTNTSMTIDQNNNKLYILNVVGNVFGLIKIDITTLTDEGLFPLGSYAGYTNGEIIYELNNTEILFSLYPYINRINRVCT